MKNPDPLLPQTLAATLARLSFYVPPQRMTEFATDYEAKVVPILKKHGLVESSERGRVTPEGVFSRLFEMKTPSEVAEVQEALQKDPAWQEVLRDLGATFGAAELGGLIQRVLDIYAAPAGPGKAVASGPGKKVSAGRGTGHWHTYDVTDGLAGASVWSILQDRERYLWFGTFTGVSRYDGQTFTTFSTKDGLANNQVNSILQDREGHLWFGTRGGGVSRYDGQTFTTFSTKDGLAHNEVYPIFQDQEGHLWFGTFGGGVSRYDPSAGSELALSETKGRAFTTFTTKDGLADNRVRAILQDQKGNLWFGTYNGVSRYDPSACSELALSGANGQAFTTFTTQDGLADNWVLSILQDREGHLWFGTYGGGVSRYDPSAGSGRAFTTFTTKDGLADNRVWSIFQDRKGHLWFGTESSGVSRYDPSTSSGQAWTTFTPKDGLVHDRVRAIFQDREGYLYFGTDGGVSRYDEQGFITFSPKDGLAHNWVYSIFQDQKGHLWFGTFGGGVSRYDGQAFTTFTTEDGLANNWVWSMLQDREGHLWFGTNGDGLSRYDPSSSSGRKFTTFSTKDGLAHNQVTSIFQDREGYLWFSTFGGVSRYDGQGFTTFTTQDGLANDRVYSIFQDREGRLWFGTEGGGISRYDGQTHSTLRQAQGSGQAWTTFTKEDGLAADDMRSISQDREGHLWFGTIGGGVSRYDGKVFQTITHEYGLASNSVWSVFEDREGALWFGTTNGVTRFCPPAPSPPPAFIDAVVADRRYEKVPELSIPSTAEVTAFEFHGMSFKTQPDAMVYRYRLKGYDEEWKNTRKRRVEYHDLPVGDYVFEVVVVDRDLVYSEQPAAVHLTVVRDTRDEQIDELERRVRERTRELVESNRRLDRARAVERVRAEVTAMKSAEDLKDVVEEMVKELTATGVDFDLCVINIVDEEAGVRRQYGATRQGWSGQVEEPLSNVSETFLSIWRGGRPVVRQVDDAMAARHAGMWRQLGFTGEAERPTVIVDAPFVYGTLSLNRVDPAGFSEEDVGLVEEFARVVALGYARFLDFQRLEAQNQQIQEANRLKSQFLASMSHELRTPMNVIIGFTNLVLRRAGELLPERQRDNLMKVKLSADHLLDLINDLLDLSKIEAGRMDIRPERFNVRALIAGCCATASPLIKPGVALNYEVPDEIGEAHTDEAKVRQIILNLLSNALKFTEKGEVRVKCQVSRVTSSTTPEYVTPEHLTRDTGALDTHLVVVVSDTGIGIPAEALSYIFEEFRQVEGSAQHKGTGLGLSITKRLTELLGGTIEVESEVGKGTTFTVRIPLVYHAGDLS